MNKLSSCRYARAALAVGLSVSCLAAGAADPGARKPERRVPPTGAQMGDIPAGVDSGTSTTSNSMQLGMPVPPSQQSADQAGQNRRSSAAARAAARPAPTAASNAFGRPIGPVTTTVQKKPPAPAGSRPASAPPR